MHKNTKTQVLSDEFLPRVETLDRQALCALVRRACTFARLDAETDGRNPPGWAITAFPYAEAIASIPSEQMEYYSESTLYLLQYLESNLAGWYGPLARACKTRLKTLIASEKELLETGARP